ncbi:short-chain dehydrogenase [Arthrobacter sp. ERGS1:01]|uniref:SDR family NAD(P)-dependent oxidoreductase n=1 Tax=Arthrobacter sp. ERGS1:01 TaxID=1704044 RepID=UPI0006B59569|nr:SDR family oxidoreductase [Arthrobacter sp. ERGS1:01]ALE05680.1 short-chain dehydrogenase [Arthrobacter sp. ERGS1:01]
MRLQDKNAIITGGGSGIGRATALAMAAEGANVAIFDINEAAAKAVADEAAALGVNAIGVAVNVADDEQVQAGVAQVVDAFGGVNVLFNNAGIIRRANVLETSVEDWDRVMAVNVRGPFLMSKYVVPLMKAAGGGAIVNTGSGWGLKGGGDAISYCTSKAAVVNMTRALAIDHGPDNIRVNSVNPGDTNTPMLREEARQLSQEEQSFLAESNDRPLKRMGTPEEIAEAVVWLASDASSYVTGSALVVDGGGIA